MGLELSPGDSVKRVDLHDQYGGRRQGGISPSKQSANVFVFTDQARGVLHGYLYDGWHRDGLFHYTGEGQFGDQRMVQGNRAIRDHEDEGRELHVFDSSKGTATYMGRFEYVSHYTADAPETGDGPMRSVIVFRLRPLDRDAGPPSSRLDDLGSERVMKVPVEQHLTERMMIDPQREPYEAERREQALVMKLMAALIGEGHQISRLQLRPDGEPAALFCDLYDETTNTIFEAKGTIARPAFRMAIGQLADYARLVEPAPRKAILLPEKPRADLLSLATGERIEVVWTNGDGGFAGTEGADSLLGD
jgi:hypothetical protein